MLRRISPLADNPPKPPPAKELVRRAGWRRRVFYGVPRASPVGLHGTILLHIKYTNQWLFVKYLKVQDFAKKLGVTEDTVINRTIPNYRCLAPGTEGLKGVIPEIAGFPGVEVG